MISVHKVKGSGETRVIGRQGGKGERRECGENTGPSEPTTRGEESSGVISVIAKKRVRVSHNVYLWKIGITYMQSIECVCAYRHTFARARRRNMRFRSSPFTFRERKRDDPCHRLPIPNASGPESRPRHIPARCAATRGDGDDVVVVVFRFRGVISIYSRDFRESKPIPFRETERYDLINLIAPDIERLQSMSLYFLPPFFKNGVSLPISFSA